MIDNEKVINEIGTPAYVYDVAAIEERIKYLREKLGASILYAVKANSFIVKEIEEEIDGRTAFLTLCIGLECSTDGGFYVLHEFASTTHIHDVMQGAVFVEGNGSVEE